MKVIHGLWLMCLMAFGTTDGWAADGVKVTITYAKDGTVKEAATSKMVTASKGKSRLGASVSINFSKQFAMEVSWQKVDETGAAIEEEDITDGGDTGGGGTTPPSGELEG